MLDSAVEQTPNSVGDDSVQGQGGFFSRLIRLLGFKRPPRR